MRQRLFAVLPLLVAAVGASLFSETATLAQDVTGVWDLNFDVQPFGCEFAGTTDLTQTGNPGTFSGTFDVTRTVGGDPCPASESGNISGNISGTDIDFTVAEFGSFAGVIDQEGASMSGTWQGESIFGDWTMILQEPVPTLPSWSLLMLALALLVVAALSYRWHQSR